MEEKEKIELGVQKFLNGEGTLSEIRLMVKLKDTKGMTKRLEEMGYHMYTGAKLSSIIGLKNAVEEYLNTEKPSLTKIAKNNGIGRNVLSKRIKELGYDVINYQNKVKFDNTMFDSIDSEEKAYWLGFIFADGYISSQEGNYNFEISLKGSDKEHLQKFNKFMKHEDINHVKMGKVSCEGVECERCRWGIYDKHLWEVLNSYGCVPKKSLILEFPKESIFKEKSLIKHFIRGYWDGDGCLSWGNKEHTIPCLGVVGTEDFLTSLKNYLPLEYNYSLQGKNSSTTTKQFTVNGKNGMKLAYYLYNNSTIYLQRKYEKYLEYCRLYKELYRELLGKNGEGCDATAVVNSEITKGSESPYSVESE